MKIVGITGGITAGKSAVSSFLISQGFVVIDCDKITDELYLSNNDFVNGLVDLFGEKIILNGEVNRGKIGSIVFSSKKQLNSLNTYCKPYIFKIVKNQLEYYESMGTDIVFIDAPTLFEYGVDEIISFTDIWVITVSRETQIHRLKRRKHYLSMQSIQNIFNSQWDDDSRRSRATFVLNNDKGNRRLLRNRIIYGLKLLGIDI